MDAGNTEDDDHLTPLMIDNHTVVARVVAADGTDQPVATNPQISTRLQDMANRVHEIPEFRPSGRSTVTVPLLHDCDATNSMGSIDSDESSRSAKDSGCESASSLACDVATTNTIVDGIDVVDSADVAEADGDFDTTAAPLELPSDELSTQIVAQVQFYFSNENILKDAFLLKHVRRNKEGFVSLKLISSFKRVRQLTRDWRVVGVAIRRLAALALVGGGIGGGIGVGGVVGIELNEAGTKVRRLDALPVFDETMPSRTVVAVADADGGVDGRLTIETVSELFGRCGEIALIRILRPSGTIPADVRQFYNKHPELHERECALVEFTESSAARGALELPGMQTYEMVAPKKKTGKKAPGSGNGSTSGLATIGQNVRGIVDQYRYPSYADVERSRGGVGGSGVDDFKYSGLRRGSAGYFVKYHHDHHSNASPACHFHANRRTSFGGVLVNSSGNIDNSPNVDMTSGTEHIARRLSNCSIGSGSDLMRKISSCSTTDSSYADSSRRASACSQDSTRRGSQCFVPAGGDPGTFAARRRDSQSGAVECQCQYARRACDLGVQSLYRRNFSNGGDTMHQHQRYANGRRVSFDGEFCERKLSSSGATFGYERKHSVGDKFYDTRKMSADSGYDRRASIGSLASEHRCMATGVGIPPIPVSAAPTPAALNAALAAAAVSKADAFVRTPIGPDGSKGFSARARKVGQVIGPV